MPGPRPLPEAPGEAPRREEGPGLQTLPAGVETLGELRGQEVSGSEDHGHN